MAKYKVHGFAMCPCEVQTIVIADTEAEAISAAVIKFKASRRKGDLVVTGSEDPLHPRQWVPTLAERID